ncbi:hypothetical protein [uncultured Roseivirga sp.]|uniref:hypothetical protein n=1 Tax=uncultured Roseivirga sp. TaxID=543088 RepID=UPI0030DC89E0|tara:strand:- start:269455 stop:270393 length:939 start_codon:yes stop_codon:yes gene_type:complete
MSVKAVMKTLKTGLILFVLTTFVAAGCKEVSGDDGPKDDSQISNLFTAGQEVGSIASEDIDEASGLVSSRSNNNYLWTHNDSGGEPIVYLMSKTGAEASQARLEGSQNTDWEDIAMGPGPDDAIQYLYVGDIGDNRATRNNLTIYRVAEPDLNVPNIPSSQTLSNVEAINYVYSNGARDAESLMVDPLTKDIYIVSKRESQVGLYVLPFPQSVVEMDTAEFIMSMPYTGFVGGDISFDGTEVLIKTYFEVYHWARPNGVIIKDALSEKPSRLMYTAEPQGEAICFSTDGSGFYTVSEKNSADPVPLFFYRRN